MVDEDPRDEAVAIIGMACRVPGADDVEFFWKNLREGVESISFAEGASAIGDRGRRRIFARGLIHGVESFDAAFFGASPAEAALTDPQHRVFLECAWQALERAGYDPATCGQVIGVYAGAGPSTYLVHHLAPNAAGGGLDVAAIIGNDKDHLTTRVAYKLGLTGPAITVQTACSTSLVAVQLAWQSLLGYQCDIALAGGVSIAFPLEIGYDHEEGFILSPDGHCRVFDARAQGTVPGDGAGVVVLKRLSEAIADGDHIHAVIRGAAVNNDGAAKVGYTAPSVEGQAQVIAMAQAVAQVNADSIGYVEAHGTGTRLGDPIEVAALTRAFRESSSRTGFSALGSVKSNIGHLNTAAGVVSLIKAALVVENAEIPPTLHFEEPNPELGLASTPFFVNGAPHPWEARGPRRAGVSSFGFGGTNAHVVLEQAPAPPPREAAHSPELLVLSARSEAALDAATEALRERLPRLPRLDLADVAFTLQVGRRAFDHRRIVVCTDTADAAAALATRGRLVSAVKPRDIEPEVVLLLPGQGAQYAGMARRLYEMQPSFRRHFENAAAAFRPYLGRDLAALIDPSAGASLERTDLGQPAIVAVDYAVSRMWMDLGVKPCALVGHSLGEYVAAHLAGVFSLDDLVFLVAARGRLMQELPEGAMVSVPLSERDFSQWLGADLAIAAINGPNSCVASGPPGAVNALCDRLEAAKIPARRLPVKRAFHSSMMDPILPRFRDLFRRVRLDAPTNPFLSGLTGTWIKESQARDPSYWVEHLRRTIRFGDCLTEVTRTEGRILLEAGPGRGLGAAALRLRPGGPAPAVVTSLGRPGEDDFAAMLGAAGQLWLSGVPLEWEKLHGREKNRRVPLPTYPFERRRYFIDAPIREPLRPLDETERDIRASLAIRRMDEYPGLARALDALCASYVVQYLKQAGVDVATNARTTRGALSSKLGVLPKFERMLDAMLRMLVEDGLVESDGDVLRFTGKVMAVKAPAEITATLEADFSAFAGIFRFLDHCAKSHADALSGRIEAIGVLYPGGSSAFVDACDKETPEYRSQRIYLELLCEAAARIVRAAEGRKLRVLEVGGGRGLLTWPLSLALAGHEVEYHFTDLGRVFVDDARAEAARRGLAGTMSFGLLDIAKDPENQGYAAQRYDLVVAFNVVHAAPAIGEALDNLGRLLAPGGTMALVEVVRVPRWDLLTWGLAEGFWHFRDERTGSPLLDLMSWERIFAQRGFERVEAYPRAADERDRTDHGLILARRPLGERMRPQIPAEARHEGMPRHERPAVDAPYLAPRSPLEASIAAIVGELLGVSRVGVRDDFFQLGADSLITLRITDRIRRELGREVPPHVAFRGATVEQLASALEGETPAKSSDGTALLLQPRGSKRPLFFVHPAAGVVFPYVELSRLLGDARPFYGLQARGLDGEAPPDTTIEQMATHYVDVMRRIQPEGPYYLGGFSFGSIVAFDVAQRLVREGHTVGFLGLVDEPAPVPGYRPSPLLMGSLLATGIARSIWPHLHDYFYLSRSARDERRAEEPFDFARILRKTRDGGMLEAFLARSTMANYVPRESMLLALRQPAMLPMFRLFVMHLEQALAYEPSAYPGRVTLFRAKPIGRRAAQDPTWGWGLLAAGGVEVHDVPGEHLTVVRKPHVEVLAARLRACLEEADRMAILAPEGRALIPSAR